MLPDIHYTDAILTVIFGGVFGFAWWSGIKLWNYDVRLTEIQADMRLLTGNLKMLSDVILAGEKRRQSFRIVERETR